MAKSTLSTYMDNTVWPWFAKFIKARDADKDGWVSCCTCGKKMRWNDSDCNAGHLVPGRTNKIIFDEQIVHGQCVYCNKFKAGAVWEYVQFMRKKYGLSYEEIEEMQNRKHVIKKFTKEELKELKNVFKSEFERISKEKGLT